MTSHEYLFGDKLDRCVESIVTEALKAGTEEAKAKAETQLEGISRFLQWLSYEGGPPFTTAIIMLGNMRRALRN